MIYEIDKIQYLQIGVQGENIARKIQINMTSWATEFPNAVFAIIFKPYNDPNKYPMVTSYDSETKILTWNVAYEATQTPGVGYTEVRAQDSSTGLVKKTRIIPTSVEDSVSGNETDPPEVQAGWVTQVLNAKTAAENARDAAEDAQEAAEYAAVKNARQINDIVASDEFNVFPVWEKGNIDAEGQDTSSNTLYRSVGFIEIIKNVNYHLSVKNGNGLKCVLYDEDGEFYESVSVQATTTTNQRDVIYNSNAKYLRFVINRYDSTYTTDPDNVSIIAKNPLEKTYKRDSYYANREYTAPRAYGYLGLTYQLTDNAADSDGQMLMYVSPNGMNWYKIGRLNAPILGKDYSTIYSYGYFYIAFDYTDKTFNEWTDDDDTYGRGGNRIGILKTNDFEKWEQTWVDLDLTWKSTWAPEIFVDDGKFYIVVTVSDDTKIAQTYFGVDRYQKDTVLLLELNETMTGTENVYDITPEVLDDPFVIDPFIIKKNDTYYLCLKNERTANCMIYKSSSLTGTGWTFVTTLVGKGEGLSIIYDSRIGKYLAFEDMRFTNRDGEDVEIARRQYGIAMSEDMETWSAFNSTNVQGDAPLRHFTPLILNQYSAPRVAGYIATHGQNDMLADETVSNKCYGLIAESEDPTISCDHYGLLMLQAGAVYRVSNGDILVDDVDCSFMRPGKMCTFVLADDESSITFAEGTISENEMVLENKSKALIVICTNTTNTNTNAFTVRCGTEARGFLVDSEDGTIQGIIDDTSTAENKVWSASKVSGELSDLLNEIDDKQDAPATAGTAGQVLGLDSNLDPVWTTPSGGAVQDVQVNGTSILSQGVANVPLANTSTPGAVVVGGGLRINLLNALAIDSAGEATIKTGTNFNNPVCPNYQHNAVFFGLAKAAGDSTQKSSSNAVGVYTESAKSSISQMLDAPETVSGTTPSITAKAGVRYICGEVSTLTIVAPASGCIDVTFTSGSTPTVLTVSSAKTGVTAIKWANGFDPTSLDANTTYEINILDGEYGVVGSWT